jgi:deoxyribose-phosphate aldolase
MSSPTAKKPALSHAPLDPKTLSPEQIVGLCDHALLHPNLTDEQLRTELQSLRSFPLASVCIKPYAVKLAADVLAGTRIGIGTVIGFPHGSHRPQVKALETRLAMDDGATEVDMVINVGKALSHDWAYCREDIKAVRDASGERGGVLKVIFETDYLTDPAAKIRLCELCSELGADYVKTSTGFGFAKQPDGQFLARGAQDADLVLMRKHCSPNVGLKASGGVRTLADAIRVIGLGVTRIGTTSTQAILSAAKSAGGPGGY